MKLLQERLRKNGLRPSFQRLKVLEFLVQNRTHPTVEMIYSALREDIPNISKTTIYNTLKVFVRRKLISDLTISGYEVRYDAEVRPHPHFLCRQCGLVQDISGVKCPHLRKEVNGNKIEEVHLYFKGVCSDCLKGVKKYGKHQRRIN